MQGISAITKNTNIILKRKLPMDFVILSFFFMPSPYLIDNFKIHILILTKKVQ